MVDPACTSNGHYDPIRDELQSANHEPFIRAKALLNGYWKLIREQDQNRSFIKSQHNAHRPNIDRPFLSGVSTSVAPSQVPIATESSG
uniref:AlNc14C70G4858 protein n=1 Tax=Albugo laibachii Nc14 TaxID=890382 RepID=F0WDZ0_9STRA|nr:AlNc14C70G4858 [Albugo laibachii Nc14]|eukprot:CCA19418.1 AlNc14C70G4858 [Albugo laibachii Nc14]